VQAVDGREQVGGALDEADERAHRDRDAALREVAAQRSSGVSSANFWSTSHASQSHVTFERS
jgi:hypothetical protein